MSIQSQEWQTSDGKIPSYFMVNVLIVAFNRPDYVKQLIKPLLVARPKKIFVALDGPRRNTEDDAIKCKAVHTLIQSTDWACDVEYLISKENYGCNDHVEKAITWFFDNIEEGIILEDDCIPDPSFIPFAYKLLSNYRDDNRISMISGMSLIPLDNYQFDYRFTRLVNIWGWATWKRAWNNYINDLSMWPLMKRRRIMSCYGKEEAAQTKLIDDCYQGQKELTWGMKWRLTCLSNNSINIAPARNLVQNIGFNRCDSNSKTFYHPIMDIKATPISFPLKHPRGIEVDMSLDEEGLRYYYESANNN